MGQDTIDVRTGAIASTRPPPARGGRRGRATRRLDPTSPCLNCGDETEGRFCPSCGQRKADIQVSLKTLAVDTLEEELSLDRRLPATLGALFLEPGQLTVDYVNGRIARYIRPVRLYLVSSLIFFVVLSFLSLRFLRDTMGPGNLTVSERPAAMAPAQLDSALAALDRELAKPDLPGPAAMALRITRSNLLEQRAAAVAAEADQQGIDGGEMDLAQPADGAESGEAAAPPSHPMTEILANLDGGGFNLGHPALNAAAMSKIRQLQRMEPREAIERLAADFLRYAPTVMFILLPVFGIMLKGLYLRRRRFYAEHFIFLLHTHAFIFLQFTVLLLLVAVGWTPGWLVTGIILWTLAYTFLAMKRVYGQGWLKTLVKWGVLGWAYFWVLSMTVPLAFLATAILA